MSCLAETFVGETFRDECLGRMKQVLAMYPQNNGVIAQSISDLINIQIVFPVDPNLCIKGRTLSEYIAFSAIIAGT